MYVYIRVFNVDLENLIIYNPCTNSKLILIICYYEQKNNSLSCQVEVFVKRNGKRSNNLKYFK